MILRQAAVFVLTALLLSEGYAQTSQINAPSTAKPPLLAELTPAQKALVEGSRKAIIQTGISEPYFAKHFKLLAVVDRESDRRVLWEFQINEYRTTVIDSIGYYTQGNERIAVHGVANVLGQTSEIQRTLRRATALRKLRSCIGNFEEPSVQYAATDGRAELVLTAAAKQRDRRSASELRREREREREKEERERRKAAASTGDLIESEEGEKDRPAVVIGTVNLITGKCTKGAGLVAFNPPITYSSHESLPTTQASQRRLFLARKER